MMSRRNIPRPRQRAGDDGASLPAHPCFDSRLDVFQSILMNGGRGDPLCGKEGRQIGFVDQQSAAPTAPADSKMNKAFFLTKLVDY